MLLVSLNHHFWLVLRLYLLEKRLRLGLANRLVLMEIAVYEQVLLFDQRLIVAGCVLNSVL